ncbi:1-deoxy-D-xylulose-5-phosphate synthase [Proteiniborus ethanoligenes]|uniref:1-deoxy-D-xylulose-5-phosphate synthase n=1 Tax=Proteiniborus ethanoligenes TaxID=415015 RepID=A0A1H3K9Z5_9FIRM|nr:1-deoxy-D-xylulose-5-phosphate synthase [Proteiniborus ethanoligenes]
MENILSRYSDLKDLKAMNMEELNTLAENIRELIIEVVSKNGGHLASNLGVVELTIALHKVFNGDLDKIIWDVGHQSYVHKILTGRKESFHTIRTHKGISGFPKRKESKYDIFETGHSSTSISAALGYALSRDIIGEKHNVISVIGDGAMTAGMAFEALNHAGDTGTDLIVVLNDNEMSISQNVGGLSQYLNRIRTAPTYFKVKEDVEAILNSIPGIGKQVFKTAERAKDSIKYFLVPGMFFEELGFKYLGPIDGHNINDMIRELERAKKVKGPVLVHVITKKGKGYKPAEEHPDKFHGSSPFNIDTGKPINISIEPSYSDILGDTLINMANKDNRIVAITAAMPEGTGLSKYKEIHKDRFFDVGIAEQHGVTLAAGLASNNLKPYFVVYSTFLQRGYDQVLHDVCIQNLPVVFAIDRAGLVGDDGETHHGVFDLSYLSHIPNITIMAPRDKSEFIQMLEFSKDYNGPLAIRYPRGNCYDYIEENNRTDIELGKSEVLVKGKDIAIIAIGGMVEKAYKVTEELKRQGRSVTLINGRFVKPLDEDLIKKVSNEHSLIVTLEDNVKTGGFGSLINDILVQSNYRGEILNIALPDIFIEHGKVNLLFKQYNMDVEGILNRISEKIK